MDPLLKKETHKISLWLKMSFYKEKQRCESLTLIYDMTLGESWSFDAFPEKISQLRWFGTPTKCSSSSLDELGIEQIIDYGSSWIKIISKSFCVSRIVLVSKL